jgi:hypothetical protein
MTDEIEKQKPEQKTKKKKWYDNNKKVYLLLFFLWPVGLYGMWQNKSFSQNKKRAFTAGFLILFGLLWMMPNDQPAAPAEVIASQEQEGPVIITSDKKISLLKISSVTLNGDMIVVAGETDLPDGAELRVSVTAPISKTEDLGGIGPDWVKVKVKNQTFSCTIDSLNHPDFCGKEYEVKAGYWPDSQSRPVQALVGPGGENLAGDNTRVFGKFAKHPKVVMEASRKISLPIHFKPYPMANAKNYWDGGPEYAVIMFLNAWKDKDWQTLTSYATNQSYASNSFKDVKELLGAEILDTEIAAQIIRVVNVKANIYPQVGFDHRIKSGVIRARVINENNQWLVMPNSMKIVENIQ